MKPFFARTESGTIYLSDGQFVRIIHRVLDPYTINVMQSKVIDREVFPEDVDKTTFWDIIQAQDLSELPVVGKSFYVAGFREWRLSTDMAEVIELEEPDAEPGFKWTERMLELHG